MLLHARKYLNTIDQIELTFLNGSEAASSSKRKQQALVVQLRGETWLFDCGEATQHRMMQTTVSPAGINRIFVSHMHGDHVYGLPGLLCNIATAYGGGDDGPREDASASAREAAASNADGTVVIVGPQGLRAWLRAVLANSYATLGQMKVQVHEIVGLQAIERGPAQMHPLLTVERPLPNEIPGLSLAPSADGTWSVPLGDGAPPVDVTAIELEQQAVPTVGWVLSEEPRPGKLDAVAVKPLLVAQGVSLRAMRDLKSGVAITLPDGTVLDPADYVDAATQRKLCLLPPSEPPAEPGALLDRVAREATLLVDGAVARERSGRVTQLSDITRMCMAVDGTIDVSKLDFSSAKSGKTPRRNSSTPPAREASIDLTFLGTSSGAPSISRNQQALAVQLSGETWLFDCGEATQYRMMQTTVSPSGINRIFVSHMHGDHVFGLPGLLRNAAASNADGTVVIVGPHGLRAWLRVVLANSYATLGQMKVQVHEIVGLQAIERGPARMRPPLQIERPLPNEIPGLSLAPSADGTWSVPLGDDAPPVDVTAIELNHTVPTVGWVLTEPTRPGKQRKLAILSDMRGPKDMAAFEPTLRGASLLIHESTNALLHIDGPLKRPGEVEASARAHGHSTPQMAGRLAARVRARHLVLTHFSPRYKGDLTHSTREQMAEIRGLAGREFSGTVTTALDLMRLSVLGDGSVDVLGPESDPRVGGGRSERPTVSRNWVKGSAA